jgi:hypothetical protein
MGKSFQDDLKIFRNLFKLGKTHKVPTKLFTVVRSDMPPGYQLAQTLHAGIEIMAKPNYKTTDWKRLSNTVICLSVIDETRLKFAYLTALRLGYDPQAFVEPDMNNQLTSFSFIAEPEAGRKLEKELGISLQLALFEYPQKATSENL